jgi:AcrR family transcriptional regulator
VPRGFNKKEQEAIKEKLLKSAVTHFTLKGMKKTSIDELALDAGISKGSFYRFYRSKEELVFDIFARIEQEKDILLAQKLSSSPESFFPAALAMIEENELFRSLYRHNDMAYLVRMMPEDYQEQNRKGDDAFSAALLERWEIEDHETDYGDSGVLTALLRILFMASLHKEEIGEGYRQAMELICKGAALLYSGGKKERCNE